MTTKTEDTHISRAEITHLPSDIALLMKDPILPHELVQGEVRKGVRRVFRHTEEVFAGEDICTRILDEVNRSKPFTGGMEGDIYKIKIGDKHIIVVKKRGYDGDNEFTLHREALKALGRSGLSPTTLVSIPKLYGKFETNGKDSSMSPEHSYIIMEYISGKTIYNLMCASVVQHWLEKGKRNPAIANALRSIIIPKPTHVELETIPRGLNIISRHERETGISFEDDAQADTIIGQIYTELIYAGIIPSNTVGKHHRLFNDIKESPVFTQEEFALLKSELTVFLGKIHNEGIYHRDVGDNPRNLMLGEDGRVYLIDFGKSKAIPPGSNEDVYEHPLENARFTDDAALVPYLASLTGTGVKESIADFHDRVKNLKSKVDINILSRTAEKYGISDIDIRASFGAYPTGGSVGGISQLFDRTALADLHIKGFEGFLGKREYKNTAATKKYAINLLIQLSMLGKEELTQLQKVIQEKPGKPDLKKVYLDYINQFISTVGGDAVEA